MRLESKNNMRWDRIREKVWGLRILRLRILNLMNLKARISMRKST
jgi:hypothetical protein